MRMEELVPIVGKLAEKYTAGESTSVTYETAEKLMGAVIYCIQEAENFEGNIATENAEAAEKKFAGNRADAEKKSAAHSGAGAEKASEERCMPEAIAAKEEVSAEQLYKKGALCVEEKTKRALALYNEILPGFVFCENQCLYDTFVKALPEFFKWYDFRFEPQNTIITLDYPVLRDLSGYTGIDRIDEFIRCIRLEQEFLSVFPTEWVIEQLKKYDREYREMTDNLCEVVLGFLLGHLLAGKTMTDDLDESDHLHIQQVFMQQDLHDIIRRLEDTVEAFTEKYCGAHHVLLAAYLSGAVEDIAVRLKNAAKHGTLRRMC